MNLALGNDFRSNATQSLLLSETRGDACIQRPLIYSAAGGSVEVVGRADHVANDQRISVSTETVGDASAQRRLISAKVGT